MVLFRLEVVDLIYQIDRRAFSRIYTITEEELGGREAFLNSYYGNYTIELAKGTINSTMVCKILGK